MVDTFVLDRPYFAASDFIERTDQQQRDEFTAWLKRFASTDVSLISGLEIKDEKLVVEHLVRSDPDAHLGEDEYPQFVWRQDGQSLLRSYTPFDVTEPPPFWIEPV